MQLWIDNTGLHGAGKCLLGEARSDYDFRGLLQLGTLIVFAETITLNRFEPPEIVENSRQFRDEVLKLGLDSEVLSVRDTSASEYASACQEAADFAAEELIYRFRPDEQLLLGVPLANIPRGAKFRAERTEQLTTGAVDSRELDQIRHTALEEKASGAIYFMLAGSSGLRDSIRQLIDATPGWSPGHTFQVESVLRAWLNQQLALQIGADYAPAAHRADLVARQNRWILDRVGDSLDPIVNELREKPLGIPSVWEALIRKSHGDPHGLISEALKMRESSTELRLALAALQQTTAADDPAAQHKVQQEIADLARGVRLDLKLDGVSSIWDAIKIDPTTGLPGPMSVASLINWLKLRIARKRRVVLTDIVLAASYSGTSDAIYRKLLHRCFGTQITVGHAALAQLIPPPAQSKV